MSHLVGDAEKVRTAGWRVLADFLFSLGFYQVDNLFGEALGLLIFLLAVTFLPGFPASPLFLDCTVDRCIPPPGVFSPLVFLGRPAHIISCLQQTGLQLFPDLFCPATTSIAWGSLCNESHLVLWLRSQTSLALLGDLLARDNHDILHMLAEGFTKDHIVNLNPSFAWGEGDQLIVSIFKTGVADDQVVGHGKLSNLSPSPYVFIIPQPCPPHTPSYSALDLPTWPFHSSSPKRTIASFKRMIQSEIQTTSRNYLNQYWVIVNRNHKKHSQSLVVESGTTDLSPGQGKKPAFG